MTYAFPPGGLLDQSKSPEGKAILITADAVLPDETKRGIVTSFLPGWAGTRASVLARRLSRIAETFSQYALEIGSGKFIWLRAVCPQACIAKGDVPFRYLLYKDVNRYMPL